MRKPMLCAFDFDNTLLDGDGLQTIVELGAGRRLPDVKSAYTFSSDALSTTLALIRDMQRTKGVTAADIRLAMRSLPATAGMASVLRLLKSRGCEVIIVSDMMTVAIDDWLSGSELEPLVDKVYANPASYDGDGYMVIEPYHRQDWCDMSFRNMCKGHVLVQHVEARADEGVVFDRLAFCGDGRNDLCPVLRLAENDLAFPREGFRLMELLRTEAKDQVKAAVHPWCNGDDIIGVLKTYLPTSD